MKALFALTIALAILPGGLALCQSGIPDIPVITVTMPNAPNADLALFVLPDGSGSPLTEAQILGTGAQADATIEMILRDSFGMVVADYPYEDLWLESEDGGMIPCAGGTVADQNTDANGFTTWQSPLKAGRSSESHMFVLVGGLRVEHSPLPIHVNSADLNGDLQVDLSDVGVFTGYYFGEYHFAADFFADGTMNLSDIGRFTESVGATCP